MERIFLIIFENSACFFNQKMIKFKVEEKSPESQVQPIQSGRKKVQNHKIILFIFRILKMTIFNTKFCALLPSGNPSAVTECHIYFTNAFYKNLQRRHFCVKHMFEHGIFRRIRIDLMVLDFLLLSA